MKALPLIILACFCFLVVVVLAISLIRNLARKWRADIADMRIYYSRRNILSHSFDVVRLYKALRGALVVAVIFAALPFAFYLEGVDRTAGETLGVATRNFVNLLGSSFPAFLAYYACIYGRFIERVVVLVATLSWYFLWIYASLLSSQYLGFGLFFYEFLPEGVNMTAFLAGLLTWGIGYTAGRLRLHFSK